MIQLKKGLDETLNFGLVTCAYPQEVWSLFAASTLFVVTPECLCDSFVVEYSDNGSNKCTKEETIIMYWYEYIEQCNRRDNINVENVLHFVSGSSKVPATGFENVPSIKFMDEERLPTVSICAISITFPRSMGLLEYESFKERMDDCIICSHGFGNI